MLKTVWNPEEDIYSWFQNWQLTIGNTAYISLDWNSREHAVTFLGYKGSMPGCELHNFTGGTLEFLNERLEALPSTIENIVLLQHHVFRPPWYIPGIIYAFSEDQEDVIRETLIKYHSVEKYFGVFAGHFHMWDNETAFDEMPTFRQWETEACKVSSAITIFSVLH